MSEEEYRRKTKQPQLVFFDLETCNARKVKQCGDSTRIDIEHVIYAFGYVYGRPKRKTESQEAWGDVMLSQVRRNMQYAPDAADLFAEAIVREEAKLKLYLINRMEEAEKKYKRAKERSHEKIDDTEKAIWLANKQQKYEQQLCTIWYAHNGGRYDIQFILKSRNLEFKSVIDANGILQLTLKSGLIRFQDTCRLFNMTLAQMCDQFKLPEQYCKSHFPYSFVNLDNLDYVGATPAPEYWEGRVVLDECKEPRYDADGHRCEFNMREMCIKYCALDIVSLAMCFYKVDDMLQELYPELPLHLSDFLTGPGLSYTIVGAKLPRSVGVVTNRAVSTWIRKAVQGGRVVVVKARFTSTSYQAVHAVYAGDEEEEVDRKLAASKARPSHKLCDDITETLAKETKDDPEKQRLLHKLYNACRDYQRDFDAVSLYPSRMALDEYPIGQPRWMNESEMEELRVKLNAITHTTDVRQLLLSADPAHSLPFAIVECTVEYKPDCTRGCFPVLGHKIPSGQLVYSFERLENTVKTIIDLAQAVKLNGAIIKNIEHVLVWPSHAPIFTEAITKMYAIKRDNKKERPAVSNVGKTLICSSYGKMLQRIVDSNWRIFNLQGGDKYYTNDGQRRQQL